MFNQCLGALGKIDLQVKLATESAAMAPATVDQLNQLKDIPAIKMDASQKNQVWMISRQPGYNNVDLFEALNIIRAEKGQDPITEEM